MYSQNFITERYKIYLSKKGFTPQKILDIGANTGQWYRQIKSIYPQSEVLSIEANPNCENTLRQVNSNYIIAFLGEKEDKTDFYISSGDSTSQGGSAYLEKSPWYENYDTQQLPVITLDSLNQEFDLIKMDVQGAEFDIIKGGLKTITKASMLQLELSFLDHNQGSPRASQIISYLYSLGFELFDVGSSYYWDGMLNQSDFLFINRYKHPDWHLIPDKYYYNT